MYITFYPELLYSINMEIREFSVRHTGEHLLIGSLVRRVPGSRVVRVVHEEHVDKAFIESREAVSWEVVLEAAREANQRVKEGHIVSIEYFDSLEEAKKRYPSLRAYEERLEDKTRIRVVNIGGFDFSACKNPHVENTSSVGLIVPLRVSSVRKGLYEVVFISGSEAVERVLKDTDILYRISRLLGCSREDIMKRVNNVVEELNLMDELRKEYTRYVLYHHPVHEGRVRYLFVNVRLLDMKHLMSIASNVMRERGIDVLAVVSWDGDKNSIFIASRGVDIEEFKSRIMEVAGGSGGGRPGMYMGYVEDVDGFASYFREYFG